MFWLLWATRPIYLCIYFCVGNVDSKQNKQMPVYRLGSPTEYLHKQSNKGMCAVLLIKFMDSFRGGIWSRENVLLKNNDLHFITTLANWYSNFCYNGLVKACKMTKKINISISNFPVDYGKIMCKMATIANNFGTQI